MLKGKKILAVVPARGGSKGIPLKNLQPIGGVPLVALVGEVLKGLPEVDRAVVSTDSDGIAEVAQAAGIDAPFRRPENISGDTIGDWDVLTHALSATEAIDGAVYDIVLMLQPTSPLRKAEHVRGCLEKLIDEDLDAVWTVSETDTKNHPLKQLTLGAHGELGYYDPEAAKIIARQQLKPVFHRNGIAYAISRDCLLNQKTIMGRKTAGVVVPGVHVSIDTRWDMALVEFILACEKRGDKGPLGVSST
jgi:CMP-N,N'-diacetyllegionaminic acid synthase